MVILDRFVLNVCAAPQNRLRLGWNPAACCPDPCQCCADLQCGRQTEQQKLEGSVPQIPLPPTTRDGHLYLGWAATLVPVCSPGFSVSQANPVIFLAKNRILLFLLPFSSLYLDYLAVSTFRFPEVAHSGAVQVKQMWSQKSTTGLMA